MSDESATPCINKGYLTLHRTKVYFRLREGRCDVIV